MNATMHAVQLGLVRGWTEFKLSMTNPQESGGTLFFGAIFLIVLIFQRNATVEGTEMSLAMVTLPSIIGMLIAVSGIMGAASALTVEREDGTLLRAKAIPHGMVGYLIAANSVGFARYTGPNADRFGTGPVPCARIGIHRHRRLADIDRNRRARTTCHAAMGSRRWRDRQDARARCSA